MRLPRLVSCALVFAGLVSPFAPGAAQICLGAASFASGPMRVSGSVTKPSGATGYNVGFGLGAARGTFGQVDFTRVSAETAAGFPDQTINGGALSLGYDIPISLGSPVHVCPVGSFGYQTASYDNSGITSDIHERILGLGGAVGVLQHVNEQFDFVPSVAVAYLSAHTSGTVQFTTFPEQNVDETRAFGQLVVTLGFVLNKRFTIAPAYGLPFGFSGSQGYWGIGAAMNFGR